MHEKIFYLHSFNATKADFINPLFSRIRPAIGSLDKVLNAVDGKIENENKMMTIVSLVNDQDLQMLANTMPTLDFS